MIIIIIKVIFFVNVQIFLRIIYLIRIQNVNRSLNYWVVVGNELIIRLIWFFLVSYEYEILYILNDIVLLKYVEIFLEEVEKEYKNGDLIQRGYVRKKVKILYDFFNVVVIELVYLLVVVLIVFFFKLEVEVIFFVKLFIGQQVCYILVWVRFL